MALSNKKDPRMAQILEHSTTRQLVPEELPDHMPLVLFVVRRHELRTLLQQGGANVLELPVRASHRRASDHLLLDELARAPVHLAQR